MDFMKYVTKGTVTAVLSVAAIIAGVFGKGSLSVFFNDPATAEAILVAAGSIGTLIAGVLGGVKAEKVTVVEETTLKTSVTEKPAE